MTMKKLSGLGFWGFVLTMVLALGAGTACSETTTTTDATDENPDDENIDEPACRLNSDCPMGQVCESGECFIECVEDRDCDSGEKCWPDVGCWPEGEEPPLTSPPREIEFSADENIEITFLGCEYDMDCGHGFSCEQAQCVEADLEGSCEWSFDEGYDFSANTLNMEPNSISHGERRLGCGYTRSTADVSGVYIIDIQQDSMTSTHTSLSFDVYGCNGIAWLGSTYLVVMATDDGKKAVEIDLAGNIVETATAVSISDYYSNNDRGFLTPSEDGQDLFLIYYHDGLARVRTRNSSGSWSTHFDVGYAPASVATNAGTLILANGEVSGINVKEGYDSAVFEEIEPTHRGLGVHHRGDGEFGWFSVDPNNVIHYSRGEPGGPWLTESTDILLPADYQIHSLGFYQAAAPSELRVDIATNPKNGEPHLVFHTIGSKIVSVAKNEQGWVSTNQTALGAVSDFEARWVGCGRPAIDVSMADYLLGEYGWFFFELSK